MRIVLKIAVLSPFGKLLDYFLPSNCEQVLPGTRVMVPFGKGKIIGLVIEEGEADYPLEKIKELYEVLDATPIFSKALLDLLIWTAKYYCYPLGKLVKEIIPPQWSPKMEVPYFDGDNKEKNKAKIILNEAQKGAVKAITAASDFQVFCLAGVTGSGKTEVYLNVMLPMVNEGKQILCLIPEINLTPQTLKRFALFFDEKELAVFHSKLTAKERAVVWQRILKQEVKVVIGTRSAIFLPFKNLGLIVIDEEHDSSFKQQTKLRYSARDLAIMRAKLEGISIVLGSATPSLETLHNVWQGRYSFLDLPFRAGDASFPTFKLVDLRGKKLIHQFSELVLRKIEERLQNKEQVLVYLNRRGFAPVLMCKKCGFTANCKNCEVKLTVHLDSQTLVCHHCGATSSLFQVCPQCEASDLLMLGLGTEKVTNTLRQIFPNVVVTRIDRDTTKHKNAFNSFLEGIEHHQILVGTQMLSKGHHFPNLTLVVILNVDYPLLSFDYRAEESLAQQIIQVSGRAGRGNRVGEVYLQTYNPGHPLLQKIAKLTDYSTLAKYLLTTRKQTVFPPYSYLALLQGESKNIEVTIDFLEKVKIYLAEILGVKIFGPIPVTLHKKAGKYREQLLFQSNSRGALRSLLDKLQGYLEGVPKTKGLQWFLEIDPLSLNN